MKEKRVQFFKKGDLIIKEGSRGKYAYMIDCGKVKVMKSTDNKDSELSVLGKGEIFGEMGLIEDKFRSASVIAIEDTEVTIINREYFNDLFGKNPNILLPIVKSLFERLRNMSMKFARVDVEATEDIKKEENNYISAVFNKKYFKTGIKNISSQINDSQYLVLTGTTKESSNTLLGVDFEIRRFPFKVSRHKEHDDSFKEAVLVKNDFYINESEPPFYVAENHFLFDKVDGKLVIVNRHIINSLYVNDEKVEDYYILKEENHIIVGTVYSPYRFNVTIKTDIKDNSNPDQ